MHDELVDLGLDLVVRQHAVLQELDYLREVFLGRGEERVLENLVDGLHFCPVPQFEQSEPLALLFAVSSVCPSRSRSAVCSRKSGLFLVDIPLAWAFFFSLF